MCEPEKVELAPNYTNLDGKKAEPEVCRIETLLLKVRVRKYYNVPSPHIGSRCINGTAESRIPLKARPVKIETKFRGYKCVIKREQIQNASEELAKLHQSW